LYAAPWNSLGDLSAAAKAKQGQLTYGSWGIASVGHVGGAMLERSTRVQMTHVPCKELPQLYGAVANGEVAWAMGTAATTGSLYRAKKVKYLAIAAPEKLGGFTEVPTVSSAGAPADFEARAIVGIFAPKGVARPIAERIEQDVAKALREPDVREKLDAVGFNVFTGSARAFSDALATDSPRFGEVVKGAKISLD
jgi:tripartite-type tricarboxylate transporter receptor subunit TctC